MKKSRTDSQERSQTDLELPTWEGTKTVGMDVIMLVTFIVHKASLVRDRKRSSGKLLVLILSTFKRVSLCLRCMGITGAVLALLGDGLSYL